MQISKKIETNIKDNIITWTLLMVYIVFISTDIIKFFPFGDELQAETPVENTNIVSVFVDSDLYNSLEDDIEWYAKDYIQQEYENTKALVLPVDTDEFKAWDIAKIQENLYLEGKQDGPSELIGTVLIGDIPLPVVNKNDYIYPSIYPYVDFEDKTFVFNKNSKYFEFNENFNGQGDIWHGIIKFDETDGTNETEKYVDYFEKLKDYNSDGNFVSNKFWYEDFIDLKQGFSNEKVGDYVFKHVLLEDLAYHRYTNLMLDILSSGFLDKDDSSEYKDGDLGEILSDSSVTGSKQLDESLGELNEVSGAFSALEIPMKLLSLVPTIGGLEANDNDLDSMGLSNYDNLEEIDSMIDDSVGSTSNIPTQLVHQSVNQYLNEYADLYSDNSISRMVERINSTGRWLYDNNSPVSDDVDNHIQSIVMKDNMTQEMIITANNKIESYIDRRIEDYDYNMLVPLFDRHSFESDTTGSSNSNLNYYFGKRAGNINSIGDLTIYKGTYRNYSSKASLSGVSLNSIRNINDYPVDEVANLDYSSVGASKGLFAQQIEANRAYNMMNAESDADKLGEEGVLGVFNGFTPLNLTNPGESRPSFRISVDYKDAKKTLYDIGGSVLVQKEVKLDDYDSVVEKYSSLNYSEYGFFDKYRDIETQSAGAGEYYSLILSNIDGSNSKDITKENETCISYDEEDNSCNSYGYNSQDKYYYKLIDTVDKHKSPNASQDESLNMTTPNRPVDDSRYITFKGVGGDQVKFSYPNLFNIPVYRQSSDGSLILKDKQAIQESIKTYISKQISIYDEKLKQQRNQKMDYYNQNKDIYDWMEDIDPLATPNSDRNYEMFKNGDNLLGLNKEDIELMAEYLYYINVGWNVRKDSSDTILKDFELLQKDFDVNSKTRYTLSQSLSNETEFNNNKDLLKNPSYSSKGYEIGYINSDGVDYMGMNDRPSIIESIENEKASFQKPEVPIDSENDSNYESESEDECSKYGDMVMLWEWPSAVSCRLSELKDADAKIEMTNSCSLGPWVEDEDDNQNYSLEDNVDIDFGLNSLYGLRLTKQKFLENGNTLKEYDKYIQNYNTHESDSMDFNAKVISKLNAEDTNGLNSFYDIKQGFDVSIQGDNTLTLEADENNNPKTLSRSLTIGSSKNTGKTEYTIGAIGPSCADSSGIQLEGTNICQENKSIQLESPYTSPEVLDMTLNTTAGSNLIQLKACSVNDDVCAMKNLYLHIQPGKLNEISVNSPNFVDNKMKVIKGGKGFFNIKGKDIWGNEIRNLLGNYLIETEYGEMLLEAQGRTNSSEFSKFDNKQFVYDSSNISKDQYTDWINIYPGSIFDSQGDYPKKSVELDLITTDVKINQQNYTDNHYTLPDSDDFTGGYYKKDDKIQKDKFIQMEIDLEDDVVSPVEVYSEGGIADVGIIKTDSKGKEYFKKRRNFVYTGQSIKIYMRPTFKAGRGDLIVDIPGLDKETHEFIVKSSVPSSIEIVTNSKEVQPGDYIKGNLFLKDAWGNNVQGDYSIDLSTVGSLKFVGNGSNSKTIDTNNGQGSFELEANSPGGVSYIYARSIQDDNADSYDVVSDYVKVLTKSKLWPNDNINIMYLNLFGNDWGNQWGYFSSNIDVYDKTMSLSDTNLAITTQLVEPTKLKKAELVLGANGKIQNLAGMQGRLSINGKDLTLRIGQDSNEANIELGSLDEFDIDIQEVASSRWDVGVDGTTISVQDENGNAREIFDYAEGFINRDASIHLSKGKNYSYSYGVYFDNQKVANIDLKTDRKSFSNSFESESVEINSSRIGLERGFAEGSTNAIEGMVFYNEFSDLSSFSNNYNSIQDSDNIDLDIGFKGDFKNISLFASNQTVGESTVPYGSDYLINYGDPLIKQTNVENEQIGDTDYDGTVGELIVSDSDKTIIDTINVDFNGDGLKDLLVAYEDNSIRLIKNYGSRDPWSNVGDIMVVDDGIEEIHAGDINGNDMNDLVVLTESNSLRVYENDGGMFDVDGNHICLDVIQDGDYHKQSEQMNKITQFFIKDMNDDDILDIVTNDTYGSINIFYGGQEDGQGFYTSNENGFCDSGYTDRNVVRQVDNYNLSLQDEKIYDNSLVNWEGMEVVDYDSDSGTDNSIIQDGMSVLTGTTSSWSSRWPDFNGLSSFGQYPQEVDDLNGSCSSFTGNAYTECQNYRRGASYLIASIYNDLVKDILEPNGMVETQNDVIDDLNKIASQRNDFRSGYMKPQSEYMSIDISTPVSDLQGDFINNVTQEYANNIDSSSQVQNTLKYEPMVVQDDNGFLPGFIDKNDWDSNNQSTIDYAKIGYLNENEDISIWKEYEKVDNTNYDNLRPGDKVKISVIIENNSNDNINFSYVERLEGPWDINVDSSGRITSFESDKSINDIDWNIGNEGLFWFPNENIISGGQKRFSYEVEYKGVELMNIDVKDANEESNFPYIVVHPSDGCVQGYNIYEVQDGLEGSYKDTYSYLINNGKDQGVYNKTFEDWGQDFKNFLDNSEENTWNDIENQMDMSMDDISQKIIDEGKWYENKTYLGGMSLDSNINVGGDLQGSDLWSTVGEELGLDSGFMGGVNDVVSSVLKDPCSIGHNIGESCGGGLSLPHSIAFAAPGPINVMGCSVGTDPGTPVFWTPGTKWVNCSDGPYPITVPNHGTVGGTPIESSAPTGCGPALYPSNFRLYLAPTTTGQLGIGMCTGPYEAGMNVPQPVSSAIGNCLVVATDFGPSSCESSDNSDGMTSNTGGEIPDFMFDGLNSNSCNSSNYLGSRANSPFGLKEGGSSVEYAETYKPPSNISYSFDTKDSLGDNIDIGMNIEQHKLKGGDPINLKIEGGDVSGLMDCVIQNWLDNQIRYILNNLTTMTVYVDWPSMDNITEEFSQIGSGLNANKNSSENQDQSEINLDNMTDNYEDIFEQTSNPFELMGTYFEQSNIINIDFEEITLQVPTASREDIDKQITYLQDWVKKQTVIAQSWEKLAESIKQGCGGQELEYDEADLENARQSCRNGDYDDIFDDENECIDFYENLYEENESMCEARASGALKIAGDMNKLIDSVEENIAVLIKWREFPMELYDYIHVIDRYVNEITCIIDTLGEDIMGRVNKNAKRFEAWTEAILLMVDVIDSRQVLVDWSVEWSADCDTCTRDNYDSHGCTLDILCPDLPILPIPPFRIPDLYVDLTNIDLGLDIVLPELNFEPTSIPMFTLPDLMRPSGIDLDLEGEINLDVSVPSLPVIPGPPSLPEIPSMMPTMEVNLPTFMPPAPMLPEIMPAIDLAVDFASMLGDLYCIIKGERWPLVAEGSLKPRIEQLTQRQNKNIFDTLKTTKTTPPQIGYDYEIDVGVVLDSKFDGLHNLIDQRIQDANEIVNSQLDSLKLEQNSSSWNDGVSNMKQETNRANESIQNELEQNRDVNYDNESDDLGSLDSFSGSSELNRLKKTINSLGDEKLVVKDSFDYESYIQGIKNKRQNLISQVQNFQDYVDEEKLISKTDKVIANLHTRPEVSPNIDGLEKVFDKTKEVINQKQNDYKDISDLIKNDYEQFLKDYVDRPNLISQNEKESMNLSTNLYNVDKNTQNRLINAKNPERQYANMHMQYIERTQKQLSNSRADEMDITPQEHKYAQHYLTNLSNDVRKVYPHLNESDGVDASVQDCNDGSCGSSVQGKFNQGQELISDNPLDRFEGFLVQGENQSAYNIMANRQLGDSAYQNENYKFSDVTGNGKDDIIYRDGGDLYIKYNDGSKSDDYENNNIEGKHYDEFYKVDNINSKYVTLGDTRFKLGSVFYGVNNFERQGQSYDSIGFGWSNDTNKDKIKGYILRVTVRSDYYDTQKHTNILGDSNPSEEYILVLDVDVDENNTKLKDAYNYNISDWIIKDLEGEASPEVGKNGIHKIIKADLGDNSSLSVNLSDLPKKWYYASIAPLEYHLNDGANELFVNGPRTKIETAGMQLMSDSQPPLLGVELIREKTGTKVDEGYNLDGYVNTSYILSGAWSDNQEVREAKLTYTGNIDSSNDIVSRTYTGDDIQNIKIENIMYTGGKQLQSFFLAAQDYAGNTTTKEVTINANYPQLSINDYGLTQDQDRIYIDSKLSPEGLDKGLIDTGYIEFQVKRNGSLNGWETLTGRDNGYELDKFGVDWDNTTIRGKEFNQGESIVLNDSNGNQIGKIGIEKGNLRIMDDYKDKYETLIKFNQNIPKIHVRKIPDYSQENWKETTQFKVYLQSDGLVDRNGNLIDEDSFDDSISLSNGGNIKLKDIDVEYEGMFKDGKCIFNNGTCVLYINSNGDMYTVDNNLYGRYKRNENGYADYYICDSQLDERYCGKENYNIGHIRLRHNDFTPLKK